MTDKRMLIDAAHAEETRVAVMDGDQLDELDVESSTRRQLKGNIYLAKVTRVEPSLQAAFVDYGGNRHGFLAFSDIHPDYYQIPIGDREQIIAEDKETQTNSGDSVDGDETSDVGNNGDSSNNSKAVETIGGDDIDEVEDQRKRKPIRRYKIQEVIKSRQILLIQVIKEERGNKGAALTTYLSLAGRYCVLMPNTGKGGGISRRISNGNDRKRLKKIISDLNVSDGMALIVRTAGAERTRAEIRRDYEFLKNLWNDLRDLTMSSIAPTLIHEEANIIKRALRDIYRKEMKEIIVEGDLGYRMAKDLMKRLSPSHAKKVQPYKDPIIPIFSRHNIESQLDGMISGNVKLKSGGYLVISTTEALVAIDVNSGRATRGRNIEETAYKTNLEAAEEIARQVRLRDLAGLVVIDFIDMEINKNQIAIERRLKEAMRRDRARIQIGRISPFGLLELSRQRLRPSLVERTTDVCSYCNGSGFLRSIESTVLHILRGIEENGKNSSSELSVEVPKETGLYMLNHKRDALAEIENKIQAKIIIHENSSLIPPEFLIDRVSGNEVSEKEKKQNQDTHNAKNNPPSKDDQRKRKRRRSRQRNKKSVNVDSTSTKIADDKNNLINSKNADPSIKKSKNKRKGRKDAKKRTVAKGRKHINQRNHPELPENQEVNLNEVEKEKTLDTNSPPIENQPQVNESSESLNAKPETSNPNVTIVDSKDTSEGAPGSRRGWWQKLVE